MIWSWFKSKPKKKVPKEKHNLKHATAVFTLKNGKKHRVSREGSLEYFGLSRPFWYVVTGASRLEDYLETPGLKILHDDSSQPILLSEVRSIKTTIRDELVEFPE